MSVFVSTNMCLSPTEGCWSSHTGGCSSAFGEEGGEEGGQEVGEGADGRSPP